MGNLQDKNDVKAVEMNTEVKRLVLKRKHYAFAEKESAFLVLNFPTIEEICKFDLTFHWKLQEHVKKQKNNVKSKLEEETEEFLNQFSSKKKSTILVKSETI